MTGGHVLEAAANEATANEATATVTMPTATGGLEAGGIARALAKEGGSVIIGGGGNVSEGTTKCATRKNAEGGWTAMEAAAEGRRFQESRREGIEHWRARRAPAAAAGKAALAYHHHHHHHHSVRDRRRRRRRRKIGTDILVLGSGAAAESQMWRHLAMTAVVTGTPVS